MDPEPLTPVRHQTGLAKLTEMAGNMGLCGTDSMSELTHAELFMLEKKKQATQTRVVG